MARPAPESAVLPLATPLVEQNLAYARRLVADLTDTQMTAQPVAGVLLNHPAWVLGHLAWVCDHGATLLGRAAALDPSWKERFSSASKPDRTDYPPKAELVSAYEAAHTRLTALALAAPPEVLSTPSAERYRARFPTLAQFVLHMLTNHQAVHLGQLSAWRRASGLPPV